MFCCMSGGVSELALRSASTHVPNAAAKLAPPVSLGWKFERAWQNGVSGALVGTDITVVVGFGGASVGFGFAVVVVNTVVEGLGAGFVGAGVAGTFTVVPGAGLVPTVFGGAVAGAV